MLYLENMFFQHFKYKSISYTFFPTNLSLILSYFFTSYLANFLYSWQELKIYGGNSLLISRIHRTVQVNSEACLPMRRSLAKVPTTVRISVWERSFFMFGQNCLVRDQVGFEAHLPFAFSMPRYPQSCTVLFYDVSYMDG